MNNSRLNHSKQREMVVGQAKGVLPFHQFYLKPNQCGYLGVKLRQYLQMTTRINHIFVTSSSSMCALNVLKSHGLSTTALQLVAQSTTIAHLLYASPTWWDYTKSGERVRIEQQIRQTKHKGFLVR